MLRYFEVKVLRGRCALTSLGKITSTVFSASRNQQDPKPPSKSQDKNHGVIQNRAELPPNSPGDQFREILDIAEKSRKTYSQY